MEIAPLMSGASACIYYTRNSLRTKGTDTGTWVVSEGLFIREQGE